MLFSDTYLFIFSLIDAAGLLFLTVFFVSFELHGLFHTLYGPIADFTDLVRQCLRYDRE